MASRDDLFDLFIARDGHPPIQEVKKLIDAGALNNLGTRYNGNMLLIMAVSYDNKELVSLLLDEGEDVNMQAEGGRFPLMQAILMERLDVARLLIQRGANVNDRDRLGCSVLYKALNGIKTKELVPLLLERGAKVNESSVGVFTLAEAAVNTLDINLIKLIIQNGVCLEEAKKTILSNMFFYTKEVEYLKNPALTYPKVDDATLKKGFLKRLFMPWWKNDLELIQMGDKKRLLERIQKKQIDVNGRKIAGESLLYWAILYKQERIAEVLIEQGANVSDLCQQNKISLISLAVDNHLPAVVSQMIEKGGTVERGLLVRAVRQGSVEMASLLIEKGADVDEIEEVANQSALQLAVREKNQPLVEVLLKNKASVNKKDLFGISPLMSAVSLGLTKIAELLIQNGADVDGLNDYDETPLLKAIQQQKSRCARLLIDRGADLKRITGFEETYLHQAIRNDLSTIAELLVEKGIDVNKQNKRGETPLHVALKNSNSEAMVEVLLDHGADESICDNEGRDAYFMAQKAGLTLCASMIKNHVKKRLKGRVLLKQKWIQNNVAAASNEREG